VPGAALPRTVDGLGLDTRAAEALLIDVVCRAAGLSGIASLSGVAIGTAP
jgi:hypothetical protein